MMLILELCFRFFCCGLFAIGGGLATLPFLYNISKETGWYTFNDISNMIAVSESTPGPMGVNMATSFFHNILLQFYAALEYNNYLNEAIINFTPLIVNTKTT